MRKVVGIKYVETADEKLKNALNKCYFEAIEVLKSCGIDVESIHKYDFKLHSRQACGMCNYRDATISVGLKFAVWTQKSDREDELLNTIIHEMLHCIAYEKSGCRGHRDEWKELAKLVNRYTGIKIARVLNGEDSNFYRSEMGLKRRCTKVRYIVKCPCGAEFKYSKRTKAIKLIEANFGFSLTCPKCKGHSFSLIKVE